MFLTENWYFRGWLRSNIIEIDETWMDSITLNIYNKNNISNSQDMIDAISIWLYTKKKKIKIKSRINNF